MNPAISIQGYLKERLEISRLIPPVELVHVHLKMTVLNLGAFRLRLDNVSNRNHTDHVVTFDNGDMADPVVVHHPGDISNVVIGQTDNQIGSHQVPDF